MKPSYYTISLMVFLVLGSACRHEPAQPESLCSYSRHIRPIIETKCAISSHCHGDSSTVANFRIFSELKARADNGGIRLRIFEVPVMPPSSFTQLTEEEKNKLKCWLDNGAPQN